MKNKTYPEENFIATNALVYNTSVLTKQSNSGIQFNLIKYIPTSNF